MAKVIWSPQALRDVARIAEYIALDNPAAAERIGRELVLAGDSLSTFPKRGRRRPSRAERELLTVRPYVVVYDVTSTDVVDILRVWHAAQNRI